MTINKYFLARLIQAFAPGIPQVYYVGFLAGKNDLELLETPKKAAISTVITTAMKKSLKKWSDQSYNLLKLF